MFALKNHFWDAQQAGQLLGFHRNFAALFVLNFCSSEFTLSAISLNLGVNKATDAIVLQNLSLLLQSL